MVSETADFMGRLEGYEMRRAELEKELSWERLLHKETRRLQDEAERERDDAIERLGPVEAELARVRREVEASARSQRRLVEARERIAELERQLERQEGLLDTARTVADRGIAQLTTLEDRLVRMRDEAGRLPAAGSNGRAPVVAGPEQELIDRAFEEADRGTERLAWLERRVGELRDGIAAQAVAEPPARPRGRGRRFRR
jgi:chromosome segregation ATPase